MKNNELSIKIIKWYFLNEYLIYRLLKILLKIYYSIIKTHYICYVNLYESSPNVLHAFM